ncbi:neck protein [Xanthomonas phage XaC1]|nr:neck protein [Xanthomonas phage XaC1]
MYEDDNSSVDYREELKGTIQTLLGGGTVDVEVTDEQYEQAITNAVRNYRAWSSNAQEEAFLHMKMYESESVYTLPREVSKVQKIYRRGNGVVSGSGATVDPFSLSYSNTYMLSAVRGSTGGGLLTYDLYHQFDETVARMFGRDIIFNFNPVTKKLSLQRDIRGEEEVLLHVYQTKPEGLLFLDDSIYPWIRDWSLSEAMLMLGRTRGKYGTIAGPQGSITLDGESLKQEALQMQERLKEDLKRFRDGGTPYGFIIG